MLKTRSLIMKKFNKLFITLAVCLGLSALFTSCSAFFDIAFNGPAKLVVSDDICEADVYIDIEVYEYNVSSNRRGNCVLSKKCVYLDRGSSKVYNICDKLDFYSCYEVVINTSYSRSGVQYTEGSASYDHKHKNIFMALPNNSYRMRLVNYYNSDFYFKLDQAAK